MSGTKNEGPLRIKKDIVYTHTRIYIYYPIETFGDFFPGMLLIPALF